jgi:CBS domain-containing protein
VHKLLDANVAGAPVVDEGGAIVGLLSESDLIWKVRGARIN